MREEKREGKRREEKRAEVKDRNGKKQSAYLWKVFNALARMIRI